MFRLPESNEWSFAVQVWGVLSLFVTVTRCPTRTVRFAGEKAKLLIVICEDPVVGVDAGALWPPPLDDEPQAATTASAPAPIPSRSILTTQPPFSHTKQVSLVSLWPSQTPERGVSPVPVCRLAWSRHHLYLIITDKNLTSTAHLRRCRLLHEGQ